MYNFNSKIENYIYRFSHCKTKINLIKLYTQAKEFCEDDKETKLLDETFNYFFDELEMNAKESIKTEIKEMLYHLAKNKNITSDTINNLCEKFNISLPNLIKIIDIDIFNPGISFKQKLNLNIYSLKLKQLLIKEAQSIKEYRSKQVAKEMSRLSVEEKIPTNTSANIDIGLFYKNAEYIDKAIHDDIKSFATYKTKDELLLKYLPLRKFKQGFHKTIKIFDYYFDKLEKNINKKDLESKLYKLLVDKKLDKEKIDKICEEFNISFYNIIDILNRDIRNINLKENLRLVLANLSYKLTEIYIKSLSNSKDERSFQQAKILIRLQIEKGIVKNDLFCDTFNCSTTQHAEFLKMLENKNHPLYIEYLKLVNKTPRKGNNVKKNPHISNNYASKHEALTEKVKTVNETEFLELIETEGKEVIKAFCDLHKLPYTICINIQRIDSNFISYLYQNKDNIKEAYKHYEDLYTTIIKEIGNEIKSKGKRYDLYEHYERYNINLSFLRNLASTLDLKEEYQSITNYIGQSDDTPEYLTNLDMKVMVNLNTITYNEETITFDNGTFYTAMEDIKRKKYPMCRGVLHGAIKKQLNETNKQDQQKTKKLAD